MASFALSLPKVGDPAPVFVAQSQKGLIHFPEYCAGSWCVLFAHPANFTSTWKMYDAFMALKEQWFDERNTKIIGIWHERIKPDNWLDKARRYLGIYFNAPIVEDPTQEVANLFGMASWSRRDHPDFNRWAYIIDPNGIVRLILCNPLPSVVDAIGSLSNAIDQLQGQANQIRTSPPPTLPVEASDADQESYKVQPAYFPKDGVLWN